MNRKILNSNNNNILIKYGFVTIVLSFVIMILGFNDINLYSIMGNSVTDKYYYCIDDSYELKGNKCYKTDYQDAILIGDVNNDSIIDIDDIFDIQLYLKNKNEFDKTQLLVADVNNDQVVNLKDIELLQMFIANKYKKEEVKNSTVGTAGKTYEAYNLGEDKICSEDYKFDKKNDRCEKDIVVAANETEFFLGDINSDGKIDLEDTKIISNYINGTIDLSKLQLKASDVNQDNIVDINDLNYINDNFIEKEDNSIEASINILNNVDIKQLDKDFKLNFAAKFNIKGSKEYHYKWFNVKSNNTIESDCSIISSKSTRYSINVTDDNEYVMLKIYDDNKCEEEINSYKTDEMKIKRIPNELYLDYKLAGQLVIGNIVNKNTTLNFNAKFTIKGNSDNKFYYRWKAIKNGKVYNPVGCYLITDGMERNPTLTINGKDQYGVWEIYNNSMCNTNGLVKTYETKHFDYYADSIKLNVNSKKIIVGDVLNLKATVISNLSNANSLVKWNSSNVAVATVNSNGIVSAKKSGTATITAFIGNIKAKSIITVIEKEGNMDITCPGIEYDSSGNNITMKIMPTPSVKTYDIYYSTNKINGSWANWSIQHSNIVGNKSITINKNNTTQVKIVAKSANGTTRNCYSGSFITGNYTTSSIAKCPNFTYSDSKSGTLRNYKQDGIKTTSGVSVRTVKTKLDSNYQYTWFTQNKDGSYQPWVTYYTSLKDISPTITAKKYNRRGLLMITDKFGNITNCYTDRINKLNLSKTTYGTTDIYTEVGYNSSDASTVKSIISSFNSNSKQYLAANKIFLFTHSTFTELYKTSACGVSILYNNDIYIWLRPSGIIPGTNGNCGMTSTSDYFKGTAAHEVGHSIDFMYSIWNSNRLNSRNGLNNYFKNYKNSGYMRSYSFNSYSEFWADLFAFNYFNNNVKVNDSLKTLRSKELSTYNSSYKNNSSKFNELKVNNR